MKEPIEKLKDVAVTGFDLLEYELKVQFNTRKQLAEQMLNCTDKQEFYALKNRLKFTELKMRSILGIERECDEEIIEHGTKFFE